MSLLEPTGPTEEEHDIYLTIYQQKMIRMVCNGLLNRLRGMAKIIDQEPNGKRKEKMLKSYDEVDGELETWQRMKAEDIQSQLDN